MTGEVTVLVADDEPEIGDLYALHLGDRYETRVATGGEEALAKLDEAVDVAVLDRRMPGVSGRDVVEHIHDRDLECHVVMVSAAEPPGDEDLPVEVSLQKPVDGTTLEDAIEDARSPSQSA
jgi:CheY-like chemotaxis protein